MAMNFPNSPTDGQEFTSGGTIWKWSASDGVWSVLKPMAIPDAPNDGSTYARKNLTWVKSVGGAVMSDTAPSTPEAGQKWIRTTDMREFVWYTDGDGSSWVEDQYADVQRPASDDKSYVMKNGIWTLAPVEYVANKFANGTSNVTIEVDLPADINWFDFEFYDMRPLSSTANYLLMQFYVDGAWKMASGNYYWIDHYTTSTTHSTWYEGTSPGYSDFMAISSGSVNAFSSSSWGFGKIFAGAAGMAVPQAIWTSRVDGARTDGSGYYSTSGRASKFRLGLTGVTALNAAANLRVKGLR